MATGNSGSTDDYVKAPEAARPEVSFEKQLSELRIAAESKIHEIVDKANQAAHDPSNRPIKKAIERDIDATIKDGATSYTTALSQLGDAFHTLESAGLQFAHQLGLSTTTTTTAAAKDPTDTTKQAEKPQQTEQTKIQAQAGKSAIQRGLAQVHDAMTSGIAVANQKLQPSSNRAESDPAEARALHSEATRFLQSLGDVINSTAQSVKDAFVTPSPTVNASHGSTPTTTNLPVTQPPAQSVSESLGQTAAALRDLIQSAWASSPRRHPHAKDSSSPVNAEATPVRPEGAETALPAGSDAK